MSRTRIYFLLFNAVVATTLLGWFRINSPLLILLLVYTLWENGLGNTLGTAFRNKYFWGYLAFGLIETAGLLHTHDMTAASNVVAKDATLVAIAIVLCAGKFPDKAGYRKLMSDYCLLVAAVSLYCLFVAAGRYIQYHDPAVFFYHPLTTPISQNAVFYSVFVLFGAIYLLSPGGTLYLPGWLARGQKTFRLVLLLFLAAMLILLSSKLILVILLVVVVYSLRKYYTTGKSRRLVLIFGLSFLVVTAVLALTDNPIRARFQEIFNPDLEMIRSEKFTPGTGFNYLQIRVLEWHFAIELLDEHHAWLFGVSPGDSQHLLDQKYIDANMWIGNPADGPHRKIRGFIGYNFHNQYIETLVRDGLLGLCALLAIFWLLAGIVAKWRTSLAFFTVLTLVVFFIPEAPLTMQTGIFLFCFFPLLLLHSPRQGE